MQRLSNKRREEILYLNGDVPVRIKDRFGCYSYTEYDALKRPRKSYVQAPPNGAAAGTTQTDYDKNSNLTQLTDTNGNLTQWSYDDLDPSISKTYPDGTSEISTFQLLLSGQTLTTQTGRLVQTTSARGLKTFYDYDENGNQTSVNPVGAPGVTMSYNALGDVAVIGDGVGTHSFSYDDYGRLTSNNGPFLADNQTYTYDELQRIETQTLGRGASGGTQSQTYAYDALGRLASLNANGTQGTGLTTYSYQANTDRLRILTHPNGTKTDLRYDAMGRLQHVFNGANGDRYYNRYSSIYDARDVKTSTQSRTGSDPATTTFYNYDVLDQLKQERVTGGVAGTAYTTNYDYDPMGNRTQAGTTTYPADGTTRFTATAGVPNALNQLTSLTTTRNNGSTYASNLGYDNAGNLTQSQNSNGTSTLYTYDARDRLTGIEQRSAANAPTSKSEFVYDYASRKAISREFSYTNGAWQQTDEKRRVFDGMDVIQERNSNNEVTAQMVRDGNIAGILSRTTATGAAFYGYDGNGNVSLLTDSAGQDVGHYRYDAFGNTLEAVGPRAGENPYRFSTKELHGPSGLVDFGFRFYSPGMGRWLNRDPIREAGGVNLYHFVHNSPINAFDSYGLDGGWAKGPWANDPYGDELEKATKGFATADEAAQWAIRNIWASSKSEGKEYGGFILKDSKTGKYTLMNPERGTRIGVDTGGLAKGGQVPVNAVGEWHTHTINDPGSEYFSSDSDETRAIDIAFRRRDGSQPWASYIGTPTAIRRYEPAKKLAGKYKLENIGGGRFTKGDSLGPRDPKPKKKP